MKKALIAHGHMGLAMLAALDTSSPMNEPEETHVSRAERRRAANYKTPVRTPTPFERSRKKDKSSSLERMLRKAKK